MGKTVLGVIALLCTAAPALAAHAEPATVQAAPTSYVALTTLFADWRRAVLPPVGNGRSDYSPAAIAKRTAELKLFRQRLAGIDRSGWPLAARHDYQLVEAEMNGLDFDLRILTPWARDPTFYATIFADWSDVPAHEGPYAHPNINLYAFKYPLNAADDAQLASLIGAIPANLAAAKLQLASSNARDLWTYGGRAFTEQSETLAALGNGTLVMNTLDGRIPADMTGASPALKTAIADAKAASDDFAAWIAAEARCG